MCLVINFGLRIQISYLLSVRFIKSQKNNFRYSTRAEHSNKYNEIKRIRPAELTIRSVSVFALYVLGTSKSFLKFRS